MNWFTRNLRGEICYYLDRRILVLMRLAEGYQLSEGWALLTSNCQWNKCCDVLNKGALAR